MSTKGASAMPAQQPPQGSSSGLGGPVFGAAASGARPPIGGPSTQVQGGQAVGSGSGGAGLSMQISSSTDNAFGQSRKRSVSPNPQDGDRPTKMARPTQLLDLRAEEEAARRMNVTRLGPSAGGSKTRETDLFGKIELRTRLNHAAKEYGLTFDEEALSYLALAAETRIRSIITQSVSAQQHRTTTSHLHIPPSHSGPGASSSTTTTTTSTSPNTKKTKTKRNKDSSSSKPIWTNRIVSDTNAVMEALAKKNREAEQAFRASRMERIAKETEMARVNAAREKQLSGEEGGNPDGSGDMGVNNNGNGNGDNEMGGMGGGADGSGPSTPRADRPSNTTGANTGISTPNPDGTNTPVFGSVKERSASTKKGNSSSSKKEKAKDVTAEVAHKMANALAMRSAGFKPGKYSWMTSVPSISSPLAPKSSKKRKDKGKDKDKDKDNKVKMEEGGEGSGVENDDDRKPDGAAGETSGSGGDGALNSSAVSGSGGPGGTGSSMVNGDTPKPSKKGKSKLRESITAETPLPQKSKLYITPPSRRSIIVESGGPPGIAGAPGTEKRVPDDKALTLVDVLFALERDGVGKGMGTADTIVKKVWARPGGPYRSDLPDGKR